MDIPHDGINLCNLLKYMTIQNERIFGIILLQIEGHLYMYIQNYKSESCKSTFTY